MKGFRLYITAGIAALVSTYLVGWFITFDPTWNIADKSGRFIWLYASQMPGMMFGYLLSKR